MFGHQAPAQFINGLKAEVGSSLKMNPDPIILSIKSESQSIKQANLHLIKDAVSEGHLELTSMILGAYRILNDVLGDQAQTVDFLKRAMMRGTNTLSMRFALWLMLYSSAGNPDRLKDVFDWLMKQYGTTFKWSTQHEETEEKHSFSIEIQRCFYFSFLSANDAPFLTPILCQLDSLWFENIDPRKHGYYFDKSRYQTLSYGAPKCVFPIVEVKNKS